jgi:hypothetical protein
MKPNGIGFEQIMEELLKQKQVLEDMEVENRELHRQLADLRVGRGIVIDILGQHFSLTGEPVVVAQEEIAGQEADVSMQETSMFANIPEAQASLPSIPETPIPDMDVVMEELSEDTSPSRPAASPIFLEEMLLEEFTSAADNQMSVWSGPVSSTGEIDEEEKAALRRELMGSFLLE